MGVGHFDAANTRKGRFKHSPMHPFDICRTNPAFLRGRISELRAWRQQTTYLAKISCEIIAIECIKDDGNIRQNAAQDDQIVQIRTRHLDKSDKEA